MDLSRVVYSRDRKVAAMRALDAGSATGEIARKYQISPHLLDRWRGEWRAKGDLAFPGIGPRGAGLPAVDDARRIGELERKLGQLTMENDFLKKSLAAFQAPQAECQNSPQRKRGQVRTTSQVGNVLVGYVLDSG